MSKYFCIGDSKGIARRSMKIYIGVNNIARKVRKIYMGDQSGIARLIYDPVRKISFSSNIEEISIDALHHYKNVGRASIGNYAIFAGGNDIDNIVTSNIDVFNREGVCVAQLKYGDNAINITGCNNDKYALFAGGALDSFMNDGSRNISSHVMYISSDLTNGLMKNGSNLSYPTSSMSSCKFREYAIFAGGSSGSIYVAYWYRPYVTGYNNDLIKLQLPSLSSDRIGFALVNVQDKFMMAAGGTGDDGIIEVYDKNLTKNQMSTKLSISGLVEGSTAGKYSLFKRSYVNGGESIIDIFDENLTKLTPIKSNILSTKESLSDGDNAIFAYNKSLEIFDEDLTRTEINVEGNIESLTFAGDDTIFLYCSNNKHSLLKSN